MTREIVTIQAGFFSNFIGTHWWNMQESSFSYNLDGSSALDINHDVLFREGLNLQREVTYTPRLVLIDLKSNVKSIQRESPLYRQPKEKNEILWDGKVDVVKENPVRRNPFLEEHEQLLTEVATKDSGSSQPIVFHDFESPECSWSEFLKTNLHPRSFVLLPDTAPSEEQSPLDVYSSGEDIFQKSVRDASEESIRRMTEECDFLQGFNVIFDAHNGFSAITHHIFQHLSDEYSRQPSLSFPVFQHYKPTPVLDQREQMHHLFAVISSLSSMNTYSSCFSPLSLDDSVIQQVGLHRKFPFLNYKERCLYHTSAICASAIETFTSQCRLKCRKFDLSDVTSSLSIFGRKLACSSIVFPFNLSEEVYLSSIVEGDVPEYRPVSLSPFYVPSAERTVCQSAVLRGMTKDRIQRPNKFLHHIPEAEEVFGDYLNKYSPSSVSTAAVFSEKLNVAHPFPKIFVERYKTEGLSTLHSQDKGPEKMCACACMSSSNSAGVFIEYLLRRASCHPFREYIKSAESSFDKDEFQELVQGLTGLQDNYQEG